jgi:hypothetical protein
MTILDKISTHAGIVPESVAEYFALRLAQRLGDAENTRWYVNACYRLGVDHTLSAYGRVLRGPKDGLAERFRSAIH